MKVEKRGGDKKKINNTKWGTKSYLQTGASECVHNSVLELICAFIFISLYISAQTEYFPTFTVCAAGSLGKLKESSSCKINLK